MGVIPRGNFMRAVAAIASVLLVSYAYAEPGGPRPDLVRALCHKDGCDEFQITQNSVVREIPDGTLRQVSIDMYKASHAGRQAAAKEKSYVYCSKRHPTLIAERPGKVVALMIAPFNPDPPETIRKSANFTAIYFTACHGIEMGRASVASRSGVAESLGYPRVVETVRAMPLKRPDEILSLYEPKPVGEVPRRTVQAEPRREPPTFSLEEPRRVPPPYVRAETRREPSPYDRQEVDPYYGVPVPPRSIPQDDD
jgi:hypothetical protein